TLPYTLDATVRPDGTFVLEGVPRGKVALMAMIDGTATRRSTGIKLDVGTAAITGIELALPEPQRAIPVLVRSTAGDGLPRALVWAISGKKDSCNLEQFETEEAASAQAADAGPIREHAPEAVRARSRPGDLLATPRADRGETSICVLG